MRLFLLLCWLSFPLIAWAYHVGPGQQRLKEDHAGQLLHLANQAVAEEDYLQAKLILIEALNEIPPEQVEETWPIRLALADARMRTGQLPEARVDLEVLHEELKSAPEASEELLEQTRLALAGSQYYMTWLMRLEGLPAVEWEPEIEAARQNYRLLAEQTKDQSQLDTRKHDLEAAIRLARMDLADLQGLKLPCQCQGCCSGQCKTPGKKPGKKPGNKKKQAPKAGMGVLPDGSGS